MDKLIEAINRLQREIGALRSDVRLLSEKVDRIQGDVQPDVVQVPEASLQQSALESIDHEVNNVQYDPVQPEGYAHEKKEPENLSVDAPAAPIAVSTAPQEKNAIENFFAWLAKDWPMKVGGFFVIAAVGWFVVYATMENLISETGRVVIGYFFAVGCIAFGAMRVEIERVQGNLFLVIGIAVMLIATLAGINYGIIMPILGLFVMLVSVFFVALVSLKQRSRALTGSMIFFGAIVPMFFFGDIGINTIFVYLFILTLGTLWIVQYVGWRSLTTLILFVVGFYSVGYILDAYGPEIETVQNIVIAFLFTAVFYGANVSTILRSKKVHPHDLVVALGSGVLFLVWTLNFSPEYLEVFLLLIGTLMFAIASYVIFMRSGHKEPTILYAGVSALLLAVATSRLFDGPVLITAYLVEATAAVVISLYLNRLRVSNNARTFSVVLYGMPLLLSLGSVMTLFDFLSHGSGGSFIYRKMTLVDMMPHLFVIFVVCVTAFSIAIAILRLVNIDEKENMTFFRVFAYIGGVYTLLLIWFVSHLFISNYDVATFISLVIYTIAGVGFYVFGAREEYAPYKLVGGILFGVVVARVLFVEFWAMSIAMRTVTSFVLGALLISTAFIRTSKK